MNKQPERTAQTKESIAEAFCALYIEKPLEKITIREITSRSGHNRSTFYQYFEDVYDLRAYVEEDLLELWKGYARADGDPFCPDFCRLLALLEKKELFLRAALSDHNVTHFSERLKQELPLNTLEQNNTGGDRLLPYLIEFRVSTSLSLLRVWIKSGGTLTKDELFALVHQLYIGGMGGSAGPANDFHSIDL